MEIFQIWHLNFVMCLIQTESNNCTVCVCLCVSRMMLTSSLWLQIALKEEAASTMAPWRLWWDMLSHTITLIISAR